MGSKQTYEAKGNSCAGKRKFESQRQANDSVTHLNQNKKTRKMKSYKCGECKGYHIGHETHARMKHLKSPTYIERYNDEDVNRGNKDKYLNIKTIK